ncbi:MAG: OsmC family protein [Planctomycetes bacterium]|nr:OsmC family protein [Planctomycetota bacterium]
MAVEINVVYEGQLRCAATHGPSGATLVTDAPVDNHGKGESFSPTDLVATALGTCVMTIMGIVAERSQIDLIGTRIHVTKEMIQQPIRRIGRLPVTVTIPADKAAKVSAADRTKIETAARHCPVHQSLHPDIDSPIDFVWLD